MKTPLALALFASVVLLGLAGCNTQPSIVGKWQAQPETTAGQSDAEKSMAENVAKMMTLEFPDEKTFKMTMIFPIEGTVARNGDTLTLTPKSIMGIDAPKATEGGKSNQEPLTLKVSADGKTLTIDSKSGRSTVFKKVQ